MKRHTRILPWENSRRLERLTEFRELVIQYFNNVQEHWMTDRRLEQPAAQEARLQINRMLDEVHDVIVSSGINTTITYTPPAIVGGYVRNVDLVHNIFLLHGFHIKPDYLLDCVDRSIGIYESNVRPAIWRLLNPFFYIGELLDLVARFPFVLIGRVGFNRQKAEGSVIGRVIKGGIYMTTALASLLTVLSLLDYLEPVKAVLKHGLLSN